MPLKPCPICKKLISENALKCPGCGCEDPFTEHETKCKVCDFDLNQEYIDGCPNCSEPKKTPYKKENASKSKGRIWQLGVGFAVFLQLMVILILLYGVSIWKPGWSFVMGLIVSFLVILIPLLTKNISLTGKIGLVFTTLIFLFISLNWNSERPERIRREWNETTKLLNQKELALKRKNEFEKQPFRLRRREASIVAKKDIIDRQMIITSLDIVHEEDEDLIKIIIQNNSNCTIRSFMMDYSISKFCRKDALFTNVAILPGTKGTVTDKISNFKYTADGESEDNVKFDISVLKFEHGNHSYDLSFLYYDTKHDRKMFINNYLGMNWGTLYFPPDGDSVERLKPRKLTMSDWAN